MKAKTKEGIVLLALVFSVAMFPFAYNEAAAITPDRTLTKTPDTFFVRGDLTSPADDKPFGGDVVGEYFLRVNGNDIKINTEFDTAHSEGTVYEGWLVDVETGYKLSLGQFNEYSNELFFSQEIVNPWIYNVLVITEEPIGDNDPSPHTPVGGVPLKAPFGQ